MNSIPHDYYLRFIDPVVYDEVLDFHSKGNYIIHPAFEPSTALHFIDDKHLANLTGNELRLYPDMDICLPSKINKVPSPLNRNESCEKFTEANLKFNTIEELISPLISNNIESYKRGYPSGGALYPVEVFICSLMSNESTWPCPEKILHLLPQSARFEIMQNSECTRELRSAILPTSGTIGAPSLAIIYVAYLPKTMFKYRYRGYRLALMEAGSIYMLIDLQAKNLNLQSRLWSAYTDSMLCKSLGLNPALFLPLAVQFVGK